MLSAVLRTIEGFQWEWRSRVGWMMASLVR
jgi:hypothetical protein